MSAPAGTSGLHGEYVGLGPLDEYPIHQLPRPVAWAGSSDRHFYDRSYFNCHDRTGDIFLISGIGYYPNLGTKDAFVLVRRGDTQTAVHLSDAADPRGADRMEQRVVGYHVEVQEPLQRLRVVLEETEGIAVDLTWRGLHPVIQELPHVMRQGGGTTLDAQRFAQVGSWEGTIAIDGEEIAVTPDRWIGSRDRSWGIRPQGEAIPAGKPADPPFEGMWWLYVPIAFDDFAICLIMQETPDGYRTVNDCTRVWPDGRVEQLGWPRVELEYKSGSRHPLGALLHLTTPSGQPLEMEVRTLTSVALHVGAGYGGDSEWTHGQWRGEDWAEVSTYDLTAADVAGRIPWGVSDHSARAVLRTPGEPEREGWGLFEHASLGRHDPTGFADWMSVAP